MGRMTEYSLKREIEELEEKIELDKETKKKMLDGVSKRLQIDPKIAEALLTDLFMSDHEGLQQGIDDLFLQTKLIHPENASAVAAKIKKAEKEAKELKEYRKAENERYEFEVQQFLERVRYAEERNARIVETNEIKVKLRLKKLEELISTPYPYDNLGPSNIHLLQVLGDEIKLERSGFLWHKVRKVSGNPSFLKDSKAYNFMMAEGRLEKESKINFKKPRHPRDFSSQYFSMYN